MVRLGGLWVNKDKQGQTYLSGDFGSVARIVILRNKNKTDARHPDWHVYVDTKETHDVDPFEVELDISK